MPKHLLLLVFTVLCACSPGEVELEELKDKYKTDISLFKNDMNKDLKKDGKLYKDMQSSPDMKTRDQGMTLQDQGMEKDQSGNGECRSLKLTTAIDKKLKAGENLVLKNVKFENINDKAAIYIEGVEGSGNTLIIEDSLFFNISWAIRTNYIDNIEIRGNYFEKIGSTMRFDYVKRVSVEYNKVKNFGVLPFQHFSGEAWSGNFVQVVNSDLKVYDIGFNLVDRSTDQRENKHKNVIAEDYININHSVFSGENGKTMGLIHDNYMRGSVVHNESISAGAIVFDQECKNFRAENNVMVNTGQYLMGNANSTNIEFINNIGFIEWKHDFATLPHNSRVFKKSGPNQVTGVITQEYGSGEIGTTLFKDNKILAERSNASNSGRSYYFNWMTVGKNTFDNNNFNADSPTGGPNSAPDGTSIIADDMFGTYGKDAKFFKESCL